MWNVTPESYHLRLVIHVCQMMRNRLLLMKSFHVTFYNWKSSGKANTFFYNLFSTLLFEVLGFQMLVMHCVPFGWSTKFTPHQWTAWAHWLFVKEWPRGTKIRKSECLRMQNLIWDLKKTRISQIACRSHSDTQVLLKLDSKQNIVAHRVSWNLFSSLLLATACNPSQIYLWIWAIKIRLRHACSGLNPHLWCQHLSMQCSFYKWSLGPEHPVSTVQTVSAPIRPGKQCRSTTESRNLKCEL